MCVPRRLENRFFTDWKFPVHLLTLTFYFRVLKVFQVIKVHKAHKVQRERNLSLPPSTFCFHISCKVLQVSLARQVLWVTQAEMERMVRLVAMVLPVQQGQPVLMVLTVLQVKLVLQVSLVATAQLAPLAQWAMPDDLVVQVELVDEACLVQLVTLVSLAFQVTQDTSVLWAPRVLKVSKR